MNWCKKKYPVIFIPLVICTAHLLAQESVPLYVAPEVGKKYSSFVLRNIENYSKKEIKVSDFKGKWLVLDFWSIGCTGCLNSFPHVSAIQQELQDKLQIMLVGAYFSENTYGNLNFTKATYNRL